MNKIIMIKNLVKSECENLGHIDDWFYDVHLLAVEDFAKKLLKKLPEADEEVVMLAVWLHDIERVRGIGGEHATASAREAVKILKEFGYDEEVICRVEKATLSHSCDGDPMPESVEAKILASADAMSHYVNNFYLHIAVTGQRDVSEFKSWVSEKLDRDYNRKIFFDFAREMISDNHRAISKFIKLS